MSMRLSYFPMLARGFAPMLVLEHAQVAWEGNPVKREKWPAMKSSGICPFGQLPILETPDIGVIGHAGAICAHVGGKRGMLGADEREMVVSRMLVGVGEDIYTELRAKQNTSIHRDKVPAEEVEKMWSESMPYRFGHLEKLLDGKDAFTQSGTTVGELTLFAMLYQMVLVKPDILKATPSLAAFYNRVLNLPAAQRVITGKSPFGEVKAHFVN